MTLGQFLMAFAALDLLLSLWIAMRIMSRDSELPAEQRGAAPYIIVILAGLITAAALCLLAFYLPQADIRLF
jgi:hypothetical protein